MDRSAGHRLVASLRPIRSDSVDEAELPGQMTIFDFPDAIPDGGMNG